MPKYAESQYQITPSTSALLVGGLTVVTACLGKPFSIVTIIMPVKSNENYFSDEIKTILVKILVFILKGALLGCAIIEHLSHGPNWHDQALHHLASHCFDVEFRIPPLLSSDSDGVDLSVVPGICSTKCNNRIPFLAILSLIMILFSVQMKPALYMITKTVDPDLISLAFAVQMVALKIFGTIPFPVILGEIIIS